MLDLAKCNWSHVWISYDEKFFIAKFRDWFNTAKYFRDYHLFTAELSVYWPSDLSLCHVFCTRKRRKNTLQLSHPRTNLFIISFFVWVFYHNPCNGWVIKFALTTKQFRFLSWMDPDSLLCLSSEGIFEHSCDLQSKVHLLILVLGCDNWRVIYISSIYILFFFSFWYRKRDIVTNLIANRQKIQQWTGDNHESTLLY